MKLNWNFISQNDYKRGLIVIVIKENQFLSYWNKTREKRKILPKDIPSYPKPFSPVHSWRKFSAVFGTTSVRSSMVILPTYLDNSKNLLLIVLNKNEIEVIWERTQQDLFFTRKLNMSISVPYTYFDS